MRFNPYYLSSAAAIAVSCVVSAAAYFYKNRNIEINEVMVFCKLQFNAYNCFDKLMSYIESAKKSINVCMPSIQNPAIQGRLLQVIQENKIKVRIIIDRQGYNYSTDFLLKELIDAGAEIKCRAKGTYNMQHKFCVVDDKVLMTGTLNWGNDLSSDHWNYVYITTKAQLVEPVKAEFYQMWNSYSNIQEALMADAWNCSNDETVGSMSSEDSTATDINETPNYQLTTVPQSAQGTPEIIIA